MQNVTHADLANLAGGRTDAALYPRAGCGVYRTVSYVPSNGERDWNISYSSADCVVANELPQVEVNSIEVEPPLRCVLMTISKGLEAIVARRLSCLTEQYDLLPVNHFRGRQQRSCEQALDVLMEKIYEVKRRGRILSLVTFDM